MMSGHATIDTAVAATRLGALNFLEKPLNTDALLITVETALRLERAESEARALRVATRARRGELVGESPRHEEARRADRRAPRRAPRACS